MIHEKQNKEESLSLNYCNSYRDDILRNLAFSFSSDNFKFTLISIHENLSFPAMSTSHLNSSLVRQNQYNKTLKDWEKTHHPQGCRIN